jgi:hypothetical protein
VKNLAKHIANYFLKFRPPDRSPGFLLNLLLLVLIAGFYAGLNAWIEQEGRTYPLDLDGWGHLTTRLKISGHHLASLFHEPSLWKGPIVPFLFGLTYYIAPFDESVLVFNAAVFALAVGCQFVGFCLLGTSRGSAILAILLWMLYLHVHRYVFGYYYAEPVISLLNSSLFLLVGWAVSNARTIAPLASGGIAGLLLLSRAPYVFTVCSIPVVLWFSLGNKLAKSIVLFGLGLILTFAPWPLRNLLVFEQFIPFTTEGGKVLFQGTYLRGDDDIMNNLRQIREFVEIEEQAQGKSLLDEYHYWRGLAIAQVRQDPLGQIYLCIRKALRFWVYFPQHSWEPGLKTGLVAALCLPLAGLGLLRSRHHLLSQLCAVWVGGLWLFHGLVHAELRYNFPILPMMFMLALTGLQSLLPRNLKQVVSFVREPSEPAPLEHLRLGPSLIGDSR